MGSDRDPTTPLTERVERILAVLHSIGPGEVVTYGDVAEDAGYPRQSRFVGRVLATTDDDVPWWRVVNHAGRLVPGNEREQSARLRAEGVDVRDGRVRRAAFGRFARPN